MDNQLNYNYNRRHVEEIKIPVPWGFVAGKKWGPKNKQPVIAIHGWQDNAGTWDKLLPLLPLTLSVLCIDLPGMGLSSHYPNGMLYYKFWDGVVLIRRIVKYYSWEKISILGHSMGGSLAFTYAACYPEEVDRIICIDMGGSAFYTVKESVNLYGMSMDQILKYEHVDKKSILFDSYEDMINLVFQSYNGSVSRENSKVMMKRGMSRISQPNKSGFNFNRDQTLKYANLGMISIEETLELASRIKCKVLNIKAIPSTFPQKDDIYKTVMAKLREHTCLTFVEIQGTHHIHLESPERILDILDQFLEDLY